MAHPAPPPGPHADRYCPEFDGMTMNERLWAAGLLDGYLRARRRRDRAALVEVLEGVLPSRADAEREADAALIPFWTSLIRSVFGVRRKV